MSTQALGGQKGSRATVGIVALTLTSAVFVLAIQATSIWSSRGGAPAQPAPVHFSVDAADLWTGAHIPTGCRPKFGCEHAGGTMSTGPLNGSQIPNGCRIKFGCDHERNTTARP
ncbi:MAG TPA: hypothetical protein VHN56_01035 [Actinomycetota bacterium]|jgi:hypothetical protein|nr:hypothetical protein [Actinomycetota bacterium]